MRIRKPFLAIFATLIIFSGYIGLAPVKSFKISNPYTHSDKVVHFLTFFLLTITFYWSFETSRRRATHMSLIVVTGILAITSEIAQELIPNDRNFDYLDIVGNVLGSLSGLGLCSIYHKRMLERKRLAKGYATISGDEERGEAGIELDVGTGPQETGVTVGGQKEDTPFASAPADLDETLDNWDENAADDWDEGEQGAAEGKEANGKVAVKDTKALD